MMNAGSEANIARRLKTHILPLLWRGWFAVRLAPRHVIVGDNDTAIGQRGEGGIRRRHGDVWVWRLAGGVVGGWSAVQPFRVGSVVVRIVMRLQVETVPPGTLVCQHLARP